MPEKQCLTLDRLNGLKVVVGLTYYSVDGTVKMVRQLGGSIKRVDLHEGIMLKGMTDQYQFVIPADLRCWFTAPPGGYHDESGLRVCNPDYLVCWDIHQVDQHTKNQIKENQWWDWVPCTVAPKVMMASEKASRKL